MSDSEASVVVDLLGCYSRLEKRCYFIKNCRSDRPGDSHDVNFPF